MAVPPNERTHNFRSLQGISNTIQTPQRNAKKSAEKARDKGWAGHLDKAFFLAQLIQLRLLLGRVEEEHTLASRSQARIPAVAQSHHSVQAIKPAMSALVSAHDNHFQC